MCSILSCLVNIHAVILFEYGDELRRLAAVFNGSARICGKTFIFLCTHPLIKCKSDVVKVIYFINFLTFFILPKWIQW